MRFNYIVYLLILTILPCFPAVAKSIEVKIEGVDGDLLKNVKAHLTILQYQDHAQANTRMVKRLHKDASTEIQSALQPFGYYQATVKKKLAQQEQHWVAHYTILLGPATTVTKLAIDISGSGKDLPAFQHWQQQFPLPVSATLVHSQYEDAKKRLLNIAAEQGFLQAKLLQHEVIVEPKSNSASITLSFDTGPRFQFGEVEFLQDILTPELLQKYLPFRHGDPFQTKQLIQLQRLLADSNYFAQVDVQPRTDQPQGLEIPIEVKLTPRKATSYTFGLGFGTDTGPRAKTGVDYRRLNRRGHQLSADLHLSPILSKASLDYRIPLRDPVKEHLSISPSWVRENTDTNDRTTFAMQANYHQVLGKWQRIIGLSLEQEQYTIGDQTLNSRLLMPQIGWETVRAKNRMDTQRGWKFGFNMRGAARTLASDTDFVQSRMNAKWITRVGENGKFYLRSQAGISWTNDFEELPVSQRFFAGGDHSIRGYKYQSVGPSNAEGEIIGGKHYLVAGLEYNHFFNEKWGTAIFWDAGNAFNQSTFKAKNGVGIGARYKLPFGTVRVDLAFAIDEPGQPWRIHVTLGPDL